jgi:hypothetical protein
VAFDFMLQSGILLPLLTVVRSVTIINKNAERDCHPLRVIVAETDGAERKA